MKRKIIIWSSIIGLIATLIAVSSIWQYNDKNPKFKQYFNGEKYISERSKGYCNSFHSYDGIFSSEALNNNNKCFITPWAPEDCSYKDIYDLGEYYKPVDKKVSKKVYSNYCYLEDLYSVYFRASKKTNSSEKLGFVNMSFNFNMMEYDPYSSRPLTGKYHMYGLENPALGYKPQNIIHYEFDPSQKNMTFKTQYGYLDDYQCLWDIYKGYILSDNLKDFPYDKLKLKNVVNIEFTCDRFDDNITITNIDNPNNVDITEEYVNNYKDIVKSHLDTYIMVGENVKEYFISQGMSYYKDISVSIKDC